MRAAYSRAGAENTPLWGQVCVADRRGAAAYGSEFLTDHVQGAAATHLFFQRDQLLPRVG